MIDNSASPCVYCKNTRAAYTCGRSEFKKKCLTCGQPKWVSVAFEVHKKIKTVDGFRAWLSKVDSQ